MNTAEIIDEDKTLQQWREYKANKSIEARNEIVLQYTSLVRKIVLRFKGSYNNFGQLDDMVNQGIIALIDAVESLTRRWGTSLKPLPL